VRSLCRSDSTGRNRREPVLCPASIPNRSSTLPPPIALTAVPPCHAVIGGTRPRQRPPRSLPHGGRPLGDLANFNPHVHALVADGVFEDSGRFVPLPPIPEALLAERLRREVPGLLCPQRSAQMRVIALIEDPAVIERT